METQVINATEYRNVSLVLLNESKTNPRRTFDATALKELADFVPGNKIGVLWRRSFCCR
jgi:ParB family chromosome partitioning protein